MAVIVSAGAARAAVFLVLNFTGTFLETRRRPVLVRRAPRTPWDLPALQLVRHERPVQAGEEPMLARDVWGRLMV